MDDYWSALAAATTSASAGAKEASNSTSFGLSEVHATVEQLRKTTTLGILVRAKAAEQT